MRLADTEALGATTASSLAPLVEVFHSIQGEGRFVGVPMAFVRVAHCPIRCLYCDTPHSYEAAATCRVGATRTETNPIHGERAAELALEVTPAALRSGARVSITGGEPLVHPGFVAALGRRLRAAGVKVHLETAALHPNALRAALAVVDHLSADWKLPGTVAAGRFEAQHRACVALGVEAGVSVDVKMVLTPAVQESDVVQALEMLAEWRRDLLLVLQPVTPFGAVTQPVDAAVAQRLVGIAAERGFEVRVLPQVHRLLGVQ